MRSDKLKKSLYFCIATIIFLVPAFIWGAQGMTNESKKDCVSKSTKEGDECKIFNDGICMKGKIKGNACIHNTNIGSLILMVLGGITLITFIGYLVMGLFGKKGKKGKK